MSRPAPMRWALVCGDGLPVSGLLTIFRNVVDLAVDAGLVRLPMTADLGYSWRPDKGAFFPSGLPEGRHPDWCRVLRSVPGDPDPSTRAAELTSIRAAVARADSLTADERVALRRRIDAAADPYEEYFTRWFADEDVGWVIAVNMTLSDGVPVTTGLHRAAERHWGRSGRPGGVLFWDHDLFGSCGIESGGERLYPVSPNDLTPVPGSAGVHRWAVVSDALAAEAATYPTALAVDVLPNVLPLVDGRRPAARHREFLASRGIGHDRAVVLVPVRLFRVKGVEIAITTFAATRAACRERDLPEPVLLIFGSRAEEPDYTEELDEVVCAHALSDAVVFLDGVPLSSHRDGDGRWHLDETDLLVLARETGGAVVFTPSTPTVESVGLGPALAARAGLPCAVTSYAAFPDVFGPDFHVVTVDRDRPHDAGRELADRMRRQRTGDAEVLDDLRRNREITDQRFGDGPWRRLLAEMAASGSTAHPGRTA